MSFDLCRTCHNAACCTFPRNRAITECQEYEDALVAPAYGWSLDDLMKLSSADRGRHAEKSAKTG